MAARNLSARPRLRTRSRFRFNVPGIATGARTVIVDHMTFIIEAVKDDHHTFDLRSSAVVAVVLALKLVAKGFEVTITTPTGDLYGADRFNLLLTETNSDSEEIVEDG
jgi:hypothetical protein